MTWNKNRALKTTHTFPSTTLPNAKINNFQDDDDDDDDKDDYNLCVCVCVCAKTYAQMSYTEQPWGSVLVLSFYTETGNPVFTIVSS